MKRILSDVAPQRDVRKSPLHFGNLQLFIDWMGR